MPAFVGLQPLELSALLRGCREISVAANQQVMSKGEKAANIIVLLAGRLRVSALSLEGRVITFRLVEPVEMVGEIGVLDGKPRAADVVAITASRLLVLQREACLSAIAEHPAIAMAMIRLLCTRLRETSDGLERVAIQRLPSRMAHLLLRLAAEFGRPTSTGGVMLPMRLSQTEIGTLVAATREAVNKQLRLWREEEIVDIAAGHIVLLKPAELAELAE